MKYIKKYFKINEGVTDSLKLKYAIQAHESFVNHCKEELAQIIETLFSGAYYSYRVGKLTVTITIDELVNTSGDPALGQYTDETQELVISLFPLLQKIKYGTGYIGIGAIDDLEEIAEEELEIYTQIVESVLVDPASIGFKEIEQVFMHELVHHWDAVNYGAGYTRQAARLEELRGEIEDKVERDRFYLGMPHEINARFVQGLARLLDNHGSGFGDWESFRDLFLRYFPRFSELSPSAQKKILKRLFHFYTDDLQDF